ncbi:MAG TPA: hypothetical protein VMT05_07865 [Terriglobales bacterium]|nr:hypothetical protein [Terriglobales bacterium]
MTADSSQTPALLSLLGSRMVRLIETHSEQLARGVVELVNKSDRCPDFLLKVPPQELQQTVQEIYQHLGVWLTRKTEREVEQRYTAIGERRAGQGVSLSQLMFAIVATKEHLWGYIAREVLDDPRPVELFREVELAELVEQFFDRAIYYAAIGYERYHAAQEQPGGD